MKTDRRYGPFPEENIKPPKKVPFLTKKNIKHLKTGYLDSLDKEFGKEKRCKLKFTNW